MSDLRRLPTNGCQFIFSCEQNSAAWPGLIEVADNDPCYLAFLSTSVPRNDLLAIAKRDQLLPRAGLRLVPFQDAVDLEDVTSDENALLKNGSNTA